MKTIDMDSIAPKSKIIAQALETYKKLAPDPNIYLADLKNLFASFDESKYPIDSNIRWKFERFLHLCENPLSNSIHDEIERSQLYKDLREFEVIPYSLEYSTQNNS